MASDSTPVKRQRLNAEDRRQRIIDSSKPVFMRSGLAGTRVRDLAAAAGVNEALLYHYFASKEDLFEAAITQPLDAAVEGTAEKAVPAFDASGAVMRAQTEAFIYDLLKAMQQATPLLGLVLFGDHASGRRYWRERFEPALERIRAVARRNVAHWPHREYDPELVVDMIFGTTLFLALEDRFRGGKKRDLHIAARELCNVLFDGIAVPDPDAQ
ncbi:MAG: hypothetical protein QOI92_998 [Chloroflexota bacterium]|nr:hypothetical protein [Chloroflexota bacterium]